MDSTWRPVQSQWLMNGNLMYASSNSSGSGNSFDTYGQVWPISHPNSQALNSNVKILWDSSKKDGSKKKLLNSKYLFSKGWRPKRNLTSGIKETLGLL